MFVSLKIKKESNVHISDISVSFFPNFLSAFSIFLRVLQILRQRGIKLHIRSRRRVYKAKDPCMQRLSLQSERTLRRSVNQVSQYRMSDACHMNTDLMCPSCFQFTFDMRVVSKTFQHPIVRHCLSSMGCMDAHLLAVRRMSPDRCIDRAAILL